MVCVTFDSVILIDSQAPHGSIVSRRLGININENGVRQFLLYFYVGKILFIKFNWGTYDIIYGNLVHWFLIDCCFDLKFIGTCFSLK